MKLEFVSYDGKYPNLCMGTLILSIDGKNIKFPPFCLSSGGNAYFDSDGNDYIDHGPWDISKYPEGFPEKLKKKAVSLVNENVSPGCCGGCL